MAVLRFGVSSLKPRFFVKKHLCMPPKGEVSTLVDVPPESQLCVKNSQLCANISVISKIVFPAEFLLCGTLEHGPVPDAGNSAYVCLIGKHDQTESADVIHSSE